MSLDAATAAALGLKVLQRDWLSANHTVFVGGEGPPTIVDTGHAHHAEMTLALLAQALDGQPLARIVNTHLHSDHCGGNRALQARWPDARTWVPAPSFEAVAAWDADRLSYRATGQHCERFRVDAAVAAGSVLGLGHARWQVLQAPGHDPDALMLFEPATRTLISGDALWEDRLAIIFPEIDGAPGFGAARATLALIESLQPRWVIPGHGSPFEDVAGALAASRRRLQAFEAAPDRHLRHAARALTMFHMMEVQQIEAGTLQAWLQQTPIFQRLADTSGAAGLADKRLSWGLGLVASLVDDGVLVAQHGALRVAPSQSP